jgi:membrane-bound lytic murein transglycosylase D
MRLTTFFLFFSFISLSLVSYAGISFPDSLSNQEMVEEPPLGLNHADAFDSLYLQVFSLHQNSEYAFDLYNPYGYAADSIPLLSDSILRLRIDEMNVQSPFNFAFNEEVRNYILFFSGKRRRLISKALTRSEYYFPLFESLLDKYNLPLELKYLSVVESALNQSARSRAGAVGLWQFMPSTGRMYGLSYNSRLDERKDMWESTEAACRHFVDLYNIYGDWNLVLAAYNAGPGNVNKAIRRSDSAGGYWEIYNYLPRETRGYVPAFIAVNYMMQYAPSHNIYPYGPEEDYKWVDTLYVREKLSFSKIAAMAHVDKKIVELYNPKFPKKYVPASSSKPLSITLPLEAVSRYIRYREDLLAMDEKELKIESTED